MLHSFYFMSKWESSPFVFFIYFTKCRSCLPYVFMHETSTEWYFIYMELLRNILWKQRKLYKLRSCITNRFWQYQFIQDIFQKVKDILKKCSVNKRNIELPLPLLLSDDFTNRRSSIHLDSTPSQKTFRAYFTYRFILLIWVFMELKIFWAHDFFFLGKNQSSL